MSIDSQIVTELPEVLNSTVQHVCQEGLIAGISTSVLYKIGVVIICIILLSLLGYLTYRIIKYFYIRRNVSVIYSENKSDLSAAGGRILDKILSMSTESRNSLEGITSLSWEQLSEQLKSGEISALMALRAYQSEALKVGDRTNCVVAWVEGAEEQAKMLDNLPLDQRGPLHGVPVSVKECYDIVGTYSTAGMTLFARDLAEEDCPAVQLVKKLGGVPFCKTNVPQVMYSLQCSNPIYGTTTNPHGEGRECGGSSGGEGAILGGRGSILGVGSDIGGSLRNPAAWCGCYSLKPSEGRHLSQLGVAGAGDASPLGIQVVGGWMSSSALALETAYRAIWTLDKEGNPQREDTSLLLGLGWDQASYEKKPRLGYFITDGLLQPASGCQRAVKEAVSRLQSRGYEVVPMDSPDIDQIMAFFNGIILADKNKGVYKDLSWDLYDSTLNGVVLAMTIFKLPWLLRKLLVEPLIGLFTRVPGIQEVYATSSRLALGLKERDIFKRRYLASMTDAGVDVLLCPAQLLPAPPTETQGTFVASVLPYIPWNVLDFPAGIAPVTTWNAEDSQAMKTDYPTDDVAYKMIKQYSEGAEKLPLSVQVVGRTRQDEQVLRILTELEQSSRVD